MLLQQLEVLKLGLNLFFLLFFITSKIRESKFLINVCALLQDILHFALSRCDSHWGISQYPTMS